MQLRHVLRAAIAFAVVGAGVVTVPAQAAPADVPHFVLFTGTYGFRHDGIQEAAAVLQRQADATGAFTLEVTEDPAIFSPATYRRVDGFMLLQTTGLGGESSPLTPEQRTDFIDFFGCGAGLVGFHAAADSGGGWPEYDALLGSYGFDFHPHLSLESRENPLGREAFNPPMVSDVTIQVEDDEHITTLPWRGFETFRLTDEIYKFKGDPRADPDLDVVLSLDEQSHYWRSSIGAGPSAGGLAPEVENPVPNPLNQVPPAGFPDDSPIAWVKTTGANDARVFYTNLGHNMATWERADYQLHVQKGIEWVAAHEVNATCVKGRFG